MFVNGMKIEKAKQLAQYLTPVWAAEALIERHFTHLGSSDLMVEPSCGHGAFLTALPASVPALGIDIDPLMVVEARRLTGRTIIEGDFSSVALPAQPTAIIGNPPFKLHVIDRFLERAQALLPDGGQVGFILPAYAFQTASRVSGYAEDWSISQEMIPRNLFPGLELPLVFAVFIKGRLRHLVGFALYHETADVNSLNKPYRKELTAGGGPVWLAVVEKALATLGGRAYVASIYAEVEGKRPTKTTFWKEKIRQTLRRYTDRFVATGDGCYQLTQ